MLAATVATGQQVCGLKCPFVAKVQADGSESSGRSRRVFSAAQDDDSSIISVDADQERDLLRIVNLVVHKLWCFISNDYFIRRAHKMSHGSYTLPTLNSPPKIYTGWGSHFVQFHFHHFYEYNPPLSLIK